MWTPCEVEYLNALLFVCDAGLLNAERLDREMEVGTEGQMKIWGGGWGCIFLQPAACDYCAITVGLV